MTNTIELQQKLTHAINKLANVEISPSQIKLLTNYLVLLNKWNQAYNLTAIRNIDDMVEHHILDSLSVLPFLHGNIYLDVGTGPGLPGIPLAIARPDCQFYLLDSNGKKTRFLQQVKYQLKLDNVTVIQSRIEDYQPDVIFDSIMSRAFALLKDFVTCTENLMRPNTRLIAMKGSHAQEEIKAIEDTGFKIDMHPVNPVQNRQHFIVILTHQ